MSKRPRRRQKREERRTVLLVTNGRKTERTYLDNLKRRVDRSISVTTRLIGGDPSTVLKELRGSRSNIRDYREVWVVVDHDGTDREGFLAGCRSLSSRQTTVHGVVSVPCFEVWLNAHYGPIRNYQDQRDAQDHYCELTDLPSGQGKEIPESFPWSAMEQAASDATCPRQDWAVPLHDHAASPAQSRPPGGVRLREAAACGMGFTSRCRSVRWRSNGGADHALREGHGDNEPPHGAITSYTLPGRLRAVLHRACALPRP